MDRRTHELRVNVSMVPQAGWRGVLRKRRLLKADDDDVLAALGGEGVARETGLALIQVQAERVQDNAGVWIRRTGVTCF